MIGKDAYNRFKNEMKAMNTINNDLVTKKHKLKELMNECTWRRTAKLRGNKSMLQRVSDYTQKKERKRVKYQETAAKNRAKKQTAQPKTQQNTNGKKHKRKSKKSKKNKKISQNDISNFFSKPNTNARKRSLDIGIILNLFLVSIYHILSFFIYIKFQEK